jgi:hypothetical protein
MLNIVKSLCKKFLFWFVDLVNSRLKIKEFIIDIQFLNAYYKEIVF